MSAVNPQQKAWLEFHDGWKQSLQEEPMGDLEAEQWANPSPYHEGRKLGHKHVAEMYDRWNELKERL